MKLKYVFLGLIATMARKVYKLSRYHYLVMDNVMLAKRFEIPKQERKYIPSKSEVAAYKKKWSKFGAVETIYVNNASALSGSFDINIMPSNIYFSVVEPALNNRKFAMFYEDKAQVDWLNKKEHVPNILVRNINGVYYDSNQNQIDKSEIDLDVVLNDSVGIVAKKSIELHGGKGVEMFDKSGDGRLLNSSGTTLTLDYLEDKFNADFIIQQQVNQHPFYKALNPSSLNTFRVLTYRSVVDDKIHILYSYLRIGAPNSRVDNISTGGVFLCLNDDGTFYDYGLKKGGKKVYQLKGNVAFNELGKAPFIDEVYQLAIELTKKHYYNRLLGFDMAVDSNGKVMHIETNTSDIGIEGLQYVMGPLLKDYTQEVMDYCEEKLKTTSRYHLYDS